MANNHNLGAAKKAKNDEFYTQYEDIEREMNAYLEYNEDVFRGKTVLLPCDDPEWSNFTKYFAQNFERFGLKKLISTSYAIESKNINLNWVPTLFETENPNYDIDKSKTRGKLFILDSDTNNNGRIDIEDLKWDYLEGDGDFRSEEVRRLRDESDIIVTNPPFSLFREFLAWIMEAGKKFAIIGNQNAITYKEIFSLIKENKIWVGYRSMNSDIWFCVPNDYSYEKIVDGKKIKHIMACWYTNIDTKKRHEDLILYKRYSPDEYPKYDNYDAINVDKVSDIPYDYDGVIGVPITFLDKYNPEQFEIITLGIGEDNFTPTKRYEKFRDAKTGLPSSDKRDFLLYIRDANGKYLTSENYRVTKVYARILIRRRQ